MAVAAWCGAAPPVAPPRPVLKLLRLGVVVDAAVSLLPARQLLRLAVGGVVLPSSHWLQLACLLIGQGSSARVGGTRSREQRRPAALLASCVEKKNKEEGKGCNTQEQRTVRKGAADGPPEVTPRYLPPCGTWLSYLPPPSIHSVPKRAELDRSPRRRPLPSISLLRPSYLDSLREYLP